MFGICVYITIFGSYLVVISDRKFVSSNSLNAFFVHYLVPNSKLYQYFATINTIHNKYWIIQVLMSIFLLTRLWFSLFWEKIIVYGDGTSDLNFFPYSFKPRSRRSILAFIVINKKINVLNNDRSQATN